MVSALDAMDISALYIKKTKIGKAINQILKSEIFDQKTNETALELVNKWKVLVKEYKAQ